MRPRALLASCLLLAGCDANSTFARGEPIRTDTIDGRLRGNRARSEEVRVWRDPDTGCQYLLWKDRRRGSMTPRLTAEGRPMCRAG